MYVFYRLGTRFCSFIEFCFEVIHNSHWPFLRTWAPTFRRRRSFSFLQHRNKYRGREGKIGIFVPHCLLVVVSSDQYSFCRIVILLCVLSMRPLTRILDKQRVRCEYLVDRACGQSNGQIVNTLRHFYDSRPLCHSVFLRLLGEPAYESYKSRRFLLQLPS